MNRIIGYAFLSLTAGFVVLLFTIDTFFEWVFIRHQNIFSWYIRPLFLVPFCYFAFKRNFAGVTAVLFALFTSMFWFSQPQSVSIDVVEFLEFEKTYLKGKWGVQEWVFSFTVPFSLWALAFAFWKKSYLIGISVLILIATGKILWSLNYGQDAGKSILIPAIAGLSICLAFVYWGYKRLS